MNNRKQKKKATETAPAPTNGEHYERRDSGFVLVKVLKGGTVVETPLSTFTASVIAELVSADSNGDKRVDGVVVEARYKDWVKTAQVPVKDSAPIQFSRSFDERLLNACLSIHPLASCAPNKQAAVVDAIKRLSTPKQTIVNSKEKNQRT